MDNLLFEDLSPEDRAKAVKDFAVKTEQDFKYEKPFSHEELLEKKDTISTLVIELHDIKAEKKIAVKHFDDQIKQKELAIAATAKQVKTKTEECVEDVYLHDDQDTGEMGYYNIEGELISTRKLLPTEKNLTIQSELRRVV